LNSLEVFVLCSGQDRTTLVLVGSAGYFFNNSCRSSQSANRSIHRSVGRCLSGLSGCAGLRITGATGATYRIEFVNQVDATNWMTLTNITLPASPYFWAEPDSVTNQLRRYYRAVAGAN
jgi:hypothetical protein